MKERVLKFDVHESIATLTLNRPDKLNAINDELATALVEALQEARKDDVVRAVVLKGEGRAFCSGDDIGGSDDGHRINTAPSDPGTIVGLETAYPSFLRTIRHLPKPVIASLHGYAVGAGCDIALASDFRIAAEGTKMGLVFITRAIAGGAYLAARYVGLGKATELLLTGEMFDVRDAEKWLMVNQVVPGDQLESVTYDWARKMALGPTKAIGYLKYALNRGLTADLEQGLEYGAMANIMSSFTEDSKEGRQAFIERRPSRFSGR